jgi:hypothetical protein
VDTLHRLWALAEEQMQRSGTTFASAFGAIGLQLERPFLHAFYTPTPLNALVFATTGGDGVHFGLLHINGEIHETSPVVMTVPMCFDRPNLIVGASLHDFLCLGCQTGYGYLEQLTYDRQAAIAALSNPDTWRPDYYRGLPDEVRQNAQRLLDRLTQALKLHPWDMIEQRLNELQVRYGQLLELSPDYEA